jgi:hypothetical protein
MILKDGEQIKAGSFLQVHTFSGLAYRGSIPQQQNNAGNEQTQIKPLWFSELLPSLLRRWP